MGLLEFESKPYIVETFGDDFTAFGVKEVIQEARTKFQDIKIVDTYSYGKTLYLDGAIQSGEYDEYIYHEALVHPALLNLENRESILILGGGEGATAREVLKYETVRNVDMIDIDGELVELCKTLLPTWSDGAFEDPRLTVMIQDALDYVKNCHQQYDLIILDLVDGSNGIETIDLVALLYTEEFFQRLKRLIKPKGAMVVQSAEFNQGEFESFSQIYRKLHPLFQCVDIYSCFVPSFTSEWGFLLCNDMQSFADLMPPAIDNRIASVLEADTALAYYDGLTHLRLFTLPKDLRKLLADDFIEKDDFEENDLEEDDLIEIE